MGTWGEILKELKPEGGRPPDFDGVRRKYIGGLHLKTGRAVILYASAFTQPSPGRQISPEAVAVNDEDIQGLMEVIHGIETTELDLIIHSPGGSLEAAEAFVLYLRSKFTDIRAIVPQMAMSAATLICCAANRILMGKHSFLGPIDPQFVLETPTGRRPVPGDAILEQFEQAKREAQNPKTFAAYLPFLKQYGPDLLVRSEWAKDSSRTLAEGWLTEYMFEGLPDGPEKAKGIVDWLGAHQNHKTHSRHIPRERLLARGLVIENLEDDQEMQDLVLSIFHATTHTFDATGAVKIIENHKGNAFIKMVKAPAQPPQMMPVMIGGQPPQIKIIQQKSPLPGGQQPATEPKSP